MWTTQVTEWFGVGLAFAGAFGAFWLMTRRPPGERKPQG